MAGKVKLSVLVMRTFVGSLQKPRLRCFSPSPARGSTGPQGCVTWFRSWDGRACPWSLRGWESEQRPWGHSLAAFGANQQ